MKEFFRPAKKKVWIALVMFIVFPWPIFIFIDPVGTGWHFVPFIGILLIKSVIFAIALAPRELLAFPILIIYLLISYVVSCFIVWLQNKKI